MRKKRKVQAISKYRSGLEEFVIKNLNERNVKFEYEQYVVCYFKPQKESKYTPDLRLANGIIIEIKGYLKREDRMKHILIQQQHPTLDIRFLLEILGIRFIKILKQRMLCGVLKIILSFVIKQYLTIG